MDTFDFMGSSVSEEPLYYDASEEQAGLLAKIFCANLNQTLLMTPDLTRYLAALPQADCVPDSFWCLFEPETLGEFYHEFVACGATCVVAHTKSCSEERLASENLTNLMAKANQKVMEAAFSAAPRYAIAEIAPALCFDAETLDDAQETRIKMETCHQAQALVDAGCEGFMLDVIDLELARIQLVGIRLVTERPVVASVSAELQEQYAGRLADLVQALLDLGATTAGFTSADLEAAQLLAPELASVQNLLGRAIVMTIQDASPRAPKQVETTAGALKLNGIHCIRCGDTTSMQEVACLFANL